MELVLEAEGICKSYVSPGGQLPVLRGVDLAVPRGAMWVVLGVSGSGKSTLLNILGTLDSPDAGTIRVRGRRVDRMGERELAAFRARSLGFVFQFHHLLPEFTAVENVMMPLLIGGQPREDARRRAREVLEAVGLSERWEHVPSELSGGEAQRVAVARALAAAPELILADEPSGNLDAAGAAALHDLLASLARDRGQTLVIVTHNERLAGMADRTVVLAGGRLTAAAGGR